MEDDSNTGFSPLIEESSSRSEKALDEESKSGEENAPQRITELDPDEAEAPSASASRFDGMTLEEQAGLITQILIPVCITMAIVIAIVMTINFPWQNEVSAAMAYVENPNDSSGQKLLGSLINALIFVGIVVAVTVLFVILYKYRCLKIIYGWLFLSTLLMLGSLGGYIFYLILVEANVPMDYFTFFFIVWNFAAVGILSIFWHAAVVVNQAYLIAVSAIMAIVFTRLPEWTTWAILAAIAVYDLFAVLCPKGPLRVLVETAQERDEPIPALVYNASVFLFMINGSDSDSDDDLMIKVAKKRDSTSEKSSSLSAEGEHEELQPLNPEEGAPSPHGDDEDEEPVVQGKGVKLGLGDFIFYSVLVGRAALFDLLAVFTSFVGIVTGLFCTIMLLAVWRKALPALPISIFFGIIFYVLTKFFLYPFLITVLAAGVTI